MIPRALCVVPLLVGAISVCRGQPTTRPAHPWNTVELFKTPRSFPGPKTLVSKHSGVRGLFYESEPYKDKATRVFAWYGVPKAASPKAKVPAVVLVHGGGGTAFDQWVALWNQRGYAAIAMDMEGHLPAGALGKRPGHAWSGPARAGIFADIKKPVKDQWMYHAVAAVVRAHSLLRSRPEVDADRTGLTGISWGGIIASNVVGVDNRFKFAIPVYGCGFLFDAGNQYTKAYQKMTPADAARCKRLWDGSSHLPRAKMPMLWVTGTNDGHFPLSVFERSYRAAAGPRTLCIRIAMRHGHAPGWAPKEIYAFADSVLRKGPALIRIAGQGRGDGAAWVTFDKSTAPAKAELCYTTDSGPWPKRKWRTAPAAVNVAEARVTANVPAGTTVYYFNLTDARGLLVSSEHVDLPGPRSR